MNFKWAKIGCYNLWPTSCPIFTKACAKSKSEDHFKGIYCKLCFTNKQSLRYGL